MQKKGVLIILLLIIPLTSSFTPIFHNETNEVEAPVITKNKTEITMPAKEQTSFFKDLENLRAVEIIIPTKKQMSLSKEWENLGTIERIMLYIAGVSVIIMMILLIRHLTILSSKKKKVVIQ